MYCFSIKVSSLSFVLLCLCVYSGCFIAASAYVDRLAMFSVSMSGGSDIIDKVELLHKPLLMISVRLGPYG